MSETEEGKRIAKLIAQRPAPRRRLPEAVRCDAIAYAQWRASHGASQASIARDLGVTTTTIRRWLPLPADTKAPDPKTAEAKTKLRRVRVAENAGERSRVSVTTQSGLRIEGCTFAEIVALVRELG
jgi:transposase-like protein